MLNDEDVRKIVDAVESRLLTKDEFEIYKHEAKESMDGLGQMAQSLVVSVDTLVKSIEKSAEQANRHERWIRQIAEKIGLKLEY